MIERLLFAGDDLPGLLGRICIVKQLAVFGADETVILKQLPVNQAAPVLFPDQYHGDAFHLLRLKQRQRIFLY